jgi:hypothetical protein
MIYTHKSVMAISVALLLTASCQKSDYDAGNNTILANNSAALLDEFHASPTSFSVTAGVTKEVLGPQGTLLRFYPNSFRDKNGNVLTGGNVKIELTEMYTAGDILKYYTSTSTGSSVLTTGGQVFIKATMNGEEVTANKYGIGFDASRTPAPGPRELHYGNNYAADHIVTWADASGATGMATHGAAVVSNASITLPSASYYMFDSCTAFNWVAGDHTYSGTFQDVTINVKLTNESFAGNVWSVVYAGLSTQRVATALYQVSFDREAQTVVYKGWVPTGTAAKLMLVIPRDKYTWFYAKNDQTLTDGITVDVTLIKASKDEMDAVINTF